MSTPSHLTLSLLLLLLLTPTTPRPNQPSWTITSPTLTDFATPNLITLQADRRRKLDFQVCSPALPTPHRCTVDTDYEKVDEIQQFDVWTYRCWDADKLLACRLAGCGSRVYVRVCAWRLGERASGDALAGAETGVKVEVGGTVNITLSCAMPPDCGGPCFDRQCDGTAFIVHSKDWNCASKGHC
ncbi:hypothetical protein F4814DRAFT_458411 [Daldinia grandis]|nr:hypothetical protein F4814DRAFT_458411 [Daldinia grandis]